MMYGVAYNRNTAEVIYREIKKGVHLSGFDTAMAAVQELDKQAKLVQFQIDEMIKKLDHEIYRLKAVKQEIERYKASAEAKLRSASRPKENESEADAKARRAKVAEAGRAIAEQSAKLARIPSTEPLERDKEWLMKIREPFRCWVQKIEELSQGIQRGKEAAKKDSEKLLVTVELAMMYMEDYFKVRI